MDRLKAKLPTPGHLTVNFFPAPGHFTVNFFPAPGHLCAKILLTPGMPGGGMVRVRIERDIIDLLAILRKGLDRALFSYIFIHEARMSGVRASITIVHIRTFYKM